MLIFLKNVTGGDAAGKPPPGPSKKNTLKTGKGGGAGGGNKTADVQSHLNGELSRRTPDPNSFDKK